MKIITIAVPDEELASLDGFLQQSNIRVVEEKDEDIEVYLYELESEEELADSENDFVRMEHLEKVLEEEIWKLHHFAE